MNPLPLALHVTPGIVALCIPIVAILVGGLGKIVSEMTRHQRKMAEMLAEQQRLLIELENRRLAASVPVAPPTSVPATSAAPAGEEELTELRARLAALEAKAAEAASLSQEIPAR